MANNSVGSGYHATLRQNMAAYDKLPKAVRQALQAADHNWSAAQVGYERNRRKRPEFQNGATIVAFLQAQDDKKHRRDAAEGLVYLQR